MRGFSRRAINKLVRRLGPSAGQVWRRVYFSRWTKPVWRMMSPDSPPRVIYFYHLPKCAGSYMNALLLDIAIDRGADYAPFRRTDNTRTRESDRELICFLETVHRGGLTIVYHHHGYMGMDELFEPLAAARERVRQAGGTLYAFMCLRDPVSHFISRVNFLGLDLNKAIHDERNHNILYKYYLYNHHANHKEIRYDKEFFRSRLVAMDDIFFQEDLDPAIRTLNQQAGTDRLLTIDKRIKPPPPPGVSSNETKYRVRPNDEQRRLIKELNSWDQWFYAEVAGGNWRHWHDAGCATASAPPVTPVAGSNSYQT